MEDVKKYFGEKSFSTKVAKVLFDARRTKYFSADEVVDMLKKKNCYAKITEVEHALRAGKLAGFLVMRTHRGVKKYRWASV